MTTLDELIWRNVDFADTAHDPSLGINPTLQTVIVSCVDPRVDPGTIFQLELGEVAVIRNVGGRITPGTLRMLSMLGRVGQANGQAPGAGWNLVVLHHTDCGITDLGPYPDLLAEYFGIAPRELDGKHVNDPRAAVAADVAVLKSSPTLPAAFLASGLVYDVATGGVEIVVPPSPLRAN